MSDNIDGLCKSGKASAVAVSENHPLSVPCRVVVINAVMNDRIESSAISVQRIPVENCQIKVVGHAQRVVGFVDSGVCGWRISLAAHPCSRLREIVPRVIDCPPL